MSKKRYEEYKESGIAWIGNIPEHWSINKLKYVSSINLSNVDKKSVAGEKEVKLCNYVDVYYNDEISIELEFMKATAKPEQIKRFKLKRNDVIITKDSESPKDIAIPSWVSEDFENVLCGYHLAQIRPNDDLDGKYLFYLLKSNSIREQFYARTNGVTRFGLGKEAIRNGIIPVPVLSEQIKIRNYLDSKNKKIKKIIECLQKQTETLLAFRQSLITETITKGLDQNVNMKESGIDWIGLVPVHWEIKKIKYKFYIKKKITDENNPTVLSLTQRGLKIKDLTNNEGQHAADYSKYQEVKPKDFVMNSMDLLTGFVDCSTFKGVTSPDYRVFVQRDINDCHEYFLNYFKICYWNKIFYGHGQGVSNLGRWRLQTDVFKNFPIPVPPKEEQKKIVEYINTKISEIDKLSSEIKNQIHILQEYQNSLIYEAVTGKIDVRDYVHDELEVEV